MIKHHPDENTLSEYCAGSIDWAVGIAVAAHLHHCPKCRTQVQNMSQVGGALLREAKAEKPSEALFAQTLAKVRALSEAEDREKLEHTQKCETTARALSDTQSLETLTRDPLLRDLPPVVEKLAVRNRLSWKKVSPSLKLAKLKTGQDLYEVAFHRICAGGKVVEHDHRGIEMTMVLKGSFSDEDGVYSEGDFIVRQIGDVHKPIAAQNQDCLCLTVSEAPVAVTGLLGKVINPFLSINPQ